MGQIGSFQAHKRFHDSQLGQLIQLVEFTDGLLGKGYLIHGEGVIKAKAAMNLGNLSTIVFSATLFLAVPRGWGGRPGPGFAAIGTARGQSRADPEEADILKRYDRNGDGRLDESERLAAHMSVGRSKIGARVGVAVYAGLLQRFDRDHRGTLTPEEQSQAIAFLRSDRPILYQALLRRFDRDRDGNLDAQETAALFRGLQRLASRQRKAGQQ